ncbi:HAD family hydrolase, partial [Mycobacterium tuberculosis]
IFLKGYKSVEATRAVAPVVFDKTGTLTTGRLQVSAVTAAPGWEADQVLALAATVEAASEHSVALASAAATTRRDAVTDFRAIPGRGVSGTVSGRAVRVGKP